MGLTGGFGLPRSLCRAVFTGGFFFELAFGVDSSADSFDADAVGVVFGFGLSATGDAETGEAGLDGADAMGVPSGLVACEAADGAAVFGA